MSKKVVIIVLGIILYLVTSVPVGLFLYSLKTNAGIDAFQNTGFHAYLSCLKQEARAAAKEQKDKLEK